MYRMSNCSAQFKDIQSDPDQMRAARLIADKPIVVISGAGGCGKTHLVTTLVHRLVLILVNPLHNVSRPFIARYFLPKSAFDVQYVPKRHMQFLREDFLPSDWLHYGWG